MRHQDFQQGVRSNKRLCDSITRRGYVAFPQVNSLWDSCPFFFHAYLFVKGSERGVLVIFFIIFFFLLRDLSALRT